MQKQKRKKPKKRSFITGTFFSKKNQKEMKYRSSYELRYMQKLEKDWQVEMYLYEEIKIPYLLDGKLHMYIPDFVIKRKSSIEIVEVKPEAFIEDRVVQAKKEATEKFLKKHGLENITYKFITEKDLN